MNKTEGIDILLLLTLTSIFFWKVLIHPDQMIYSQHSDIVAPFSGWKQFTVESLKQYGELPLWNPYEYSGIPFVSNIQAISFYPLSILFLFAPVELVFSHLFILHVFLAGVFTYLFTRYIGLDRFSSLVSAVIFMFTGNIIGRLYAGQIINITTVAWIPLIFLLFEAALRKRSLFYGALTGAAMSIQFLAGQTQIFLYTSFCLFLYSLFRSILTFSEEKDSKNVIRSSSILISAIIVCSLLSAIQLLPSFELSKYFYRAGGVGYEFATAFYSFPPEQLITFVLPEFFGSALDNTYQGSGNFWELLAYVGILPLILACTALRFERNKYVISFFGLAVFSLLFSMGKYTPFFSIFYHLVPGFDMFRQPTKMLILLSFSVSVLSGFGSSFLIGDVKEIEKKIRKLTKFLILITILILLGTSFGTFFRDNIISFGKEIVTGRYYAHAGPEFPIEYYYELVDSIFSHILNNLYVLSMILIAITSLFILRLKKKFNLQHFKSFLVLIILFDLWIFGMKYIDVSEPAEVFEKNDVVKFLENDTSPYRVFALNNTLPHYLLERYRIHSLEGYDPVPLRYYIEFEYNIVNSTLMDLPPGWYPEPIDSLCEKGCYPKLLDLLNVKYIMSTDEIKNDRFVLRFNQTVEYRHENKKRRVHIYENKHVLPRTFVVRTAKVIYNEKKILKELKSDDFDPKDYVIIEEDAPKEILNNSGTFETAEISYYSPNEVIVNADVSTPGFLVLADTWYPGWKAYIDDEESKIYKTDYVLRSVYLNKGNHSIRFVYEPSSFKIGLWISLLTLIVLVVIPFVKLK